MKLSELQKLNDDDVSSLSWVKLNVNDKPETLTKQRAILMHSFTIKPAVDVGCNTGGYTIYTECDVGLDFNKHLLIKAKKDGKHVDFINCCAEFLPFKPDSFRTALATEVLEHVNNPEEVVKEISRIAKRIIVTVPIVEDRPSRGHLRLFSVNEIKKLVTTYFPTVWHEQMLTEGKMKCFFICAEKRS